MSAETHEFQAETRQLLQLMVHSLYAHREVFLRELVSNASDACDKLRFEAIAQPDLYGDSPDLGIDIVVDKAAGTLTIRDNGIGMSHEEVTTNLGTIAHSGTKKFLESLSDDDSVNQELIGQFGVGFYSAFIVADRVSVLTRRAGSLAAVRWESDGTGTYTIEEAEKAARGTDITLHLRSEDAEYLDAERLRILVRRYSDHINLPIRLCAGASDGEIINRSGAFWTRSKSELSDNDYREFYKHMTQEECAPLAWAHHRVEGTQEYTSLLYIPGQAMPNLMSRDQERGIQLFVKRVFVMDHATELLPAYLRFVRGLVDSSDLPLNVSREVLQSNRVVDKIRGALVRRVLDLLDELATNRADDYQRFWHLFGVVLKEGLVEDAINRDRIAKLCLFQSTEQSNDSLTSLDDYISRMKPDQTNIYYLTTDTSSKPIASPHLEGYKARGYEVLLLTDRVDEWVVMHLSEYSGKPLVSCARGRSDLEPNVETAENVAEKEDLSAVCERLKQYLNNRVESVRLSQRLTESPACLVTPEYGLSRRLGQILKQAGEMAPEVPPVLELNGKHPLVKRISEAANGDFNDLAELLYGQAVLAEGGQLEDPSGFVRSLNNLVVGRSNPQSSIIVPG